MLKINLILAVILIPAYAMAVTPTHHTHQQTLTQTQATEVTQDKQAIKTDKQSLQNTYQILHVDEQNGNATQVAAVQHQIAQLKGELLTDNIDLREDGAYTYATRHSISGWGNGFNNSNNSNNSNNNSNNSNNSGHHHYNGWGQ